MSVKSEQAKRMHDEGYNCAQSVAAVFAEDYGISRDELLKLSSGFGGGAQNAELCGAVSGGVMVIGLKYGNGGVNSPEAKAECYAKTKEFTALFQRRNENLTCRDLLGIDMFKADGPAAEEEVSRRKKRCTELIEGAVLMLEQLGY